LKAVKPIPDQFEVGELVRYKDRNKHRVGEVVAADERTVTVKLFGDAKRREVPRSQAVPFAQFLAESGTRKLKNVYAEFFGEGPQKRMPSKRLDELRQILNEHGVHFDESRTRADDFFRMEMNPAHLTQREREERARKSILPDAITTWLPKWLVSDPLPPSSRDPLGLQADAGRLADQVLPGLTVFTNRVGYFFFLSWAVRELNKRERLAAGERRELLNRLERALVMCETVYHGLEGFSQCFHQGQRRKGQLLAQANQTAAILIPDRILKNQNNTGGYNLYRTALRSGGFWENDDEAGAAGRLPLRLTERGERLANTFGRREGAKELLQWALDERGKRQVKQLQRWGQSLCFQTFHSRRSEKKIFLEGFLFARGDRADVVCDADTRLSSLRTLAEAGLLFGSEPARTVTTMVSMETAGADVTELGGSDNDSQETDQPSFTESGENVAFLLRFYRQRDMAGAEPFVAAVVYELLSLGLSAVWAELLDHVTRFGRTSLRSWVDTLPGESSTPQFWNASVTAAAGMVPFSEEQLVDHLFGGENKAESGLMLVIKVLAREDNRVILSDQLSQVAIRHLLEGNFLSDPDTSVREVLLDLVPRLIKHHQAVSERKGKECWLDMDDNGMHILKVDPREIDMALGFHSYRLPQLMSLVRDLRLEPDDLQDA
jgi:hypothetical protein